VDAKDDSINSKYSNPKKKELDHIGSHRRRIDKGEVDINMESLRMGTEMIVEASGHKIDRSRGCSIRLGDPKDMKGGDSTQRLLTVDNVNIL
jgi:hypothetical protein